MPNQCFFITFAKELKTILKVAPDTNQGRIMKRKKLYVLTFALLAVLCAGLVSCDNDDNEALYDNEDTTNDDNEDTTGLYVNFVYDYNIQHTDMFKDYVGSVTLYVFDESDRLVAQRTVSGSELSVYGFNIHFTEQELAPGHQYRLSAVALQKDWNAALATPGAKYRKTTLNTGNRRQQLMVSLDRATATTNNYHEVSTTAPLDTMWHTKQVMTAYAANQPTATHYHENAEGETTTNAVETITLESGVPAYATVSLVRNTNHLNISIRELDTPENVDADNYEVFILDANGDVDYQNTVITPTDSLVYRPYQQWTTTFDGITGVERSAHYDLMCNRLIYNTTTDDNAVLCIRRKSNGKEVAVLNLPYILCEGRTAYETYNYRPQEYLDREYDYRLEFFLRGDRWVYLTVCIDRFSWGKRIQNTSFN